jgi:hypothetical protein
MALSTLLVSSNSRANFSKVNLTPSSNSKGKGNNNSSDIVMPEVLLVKLKEAVRVALLDKFNNNRRNLTVFLL